MDSTYYSIVFQYIHISCIKKIIHHWLCPSISPMVIWSCILLLLYPSTGIASSSLEDGRSQKRVGFFWGFQKWGYPGPQTCSMYGNLICMLVMFDGQICWYCKSSIHGAYGKSSISVWDCPLWSIRFGVHHGTPFSGKSPYSWDFIDMSWNINGLFIGYSRDLLNIYQNIMTYPM